MEILRTPEEWFDELEGFPFEPRYCEIPIDPHTQVRVHYIDEGPREGPVVLLLHGEPTWSYLWRKVVPGLASNGLRVVALDLPGFGRSDKPAEPERYSLSDLTHWTRLAAILRMELERLTIVGHGIGALIGLSLIPAHHQIVQGVIALSAPLPLRGAGAGASAGLKRHGDDLVGLAPADFVERHSYKGLLHRDRRAYEAPFRDDRHRVAFGMALQRGDPMATSLVDSMEELAAKIEPLETDMLFVSGDRDELTATFEPGSGERHATMTLAEAGHFLPEDQPEKLVELIVDYARKLG